MTMTHDQILEALRRVHDPELHRDIISLNMVKQIDIEGPRVRIGIELTTPSCPMKDTIRRSIENELTRLDGIRIVDINWSARPAQLTPAPASLPGVKNIIAIGAGKGGVGKSTVALLAALGLQRTGARVGLLDADVYGPSIPKMLGMEGRQPQLSGERIIPLDAYELRVMSMGFLLDPDRAVVWRGPMVHGVVKQFLTQVDWGELDYLIIDLPPGTGDVPLTLAQSLSMTGAVIVCTPQEVALLDAVRALRMYRQLGVPIIGMVENMSYFVAPDTGQVYDLFGRGGAHRAAQRIDIPFLGEIPINIAIRTAGDQGQPGANFDETDPATRQAITSFVNTLVDRIKTMNARRRPLPQLTIK